MAGIRGDAIGLAIVILAILFPLSFCTIKIRQSENEQITTLKKACIEARGEWEFGWGKNGCKFPDSKEKSDG